MMNPHSWIHMDVTEPDGKVVRWQVETGSTNALYRRGWSKESLKAGEIIIVEGYAAKVTPHVANASAVKLPDGKRLFAGSSRGEAEK
jgi:outer membrane usher protein FimD/PapC